MPFFLFFIKKYMLSNKKGFTPLEISKYSSAKTNFPKSENYGRRKFNNNKFLTGFTLIELLVVIAIIGLLATIVLVSLNSARQKSRDARRATEIKQISTALEMYFVDRTPGAYPTAAAGTSIPASVKTALASYMAIVPDDPQGAARGYGWLNNTADSSNFCVYVQNEANVNYIVASRAGTGLRNAVPATLATCVRNL